MRGMSRSNAAGSPEPPRSDEMTTPVTTASAWRESEPPEPEDPIDEVIAESFPASDPPPWWAGPSS
jgi:hypothetical protein